MTDTEVDTDDCPAARRSATVQQVVTRMQARGITPATQVLGWLEDYAAGKIRYTQLLELICNRVDALHARMNSLFERRAVLES